jgi:hypothetical protein
MADLVVMARSSRVRGSLGKLRAARTLLCAVGMRRPAFLLPLGLVLLVACGATESSTSATPDGGSSGASSSGSTGSSRPPDANGCCAPDQTQSGCMDLGGSAMEGGCFKSCDFWCSTNWRIEKDQKGCDVWRYDMRAPGPEETSLCGPKPDAGMDAGGDADVGDASNDG